MEGKSNFFILLFIVAILTLTLAVLAGYLFLVGTPHNTVDSTQKAGTVRPSDDQLVTLQVFEDKKYFNLKSTDNSKMSVIQLSAELVYYKEVKGIKNVATKIAAYDGEIKELIGTYFQNMSIDEVRKPETKEKAKKELTAKINELLNESEKSKADIVYTINFDEWFYQ